ncbi:DUF488 domain-containing protein [Nocardioides massiliensis]|uniref:Uncharacterized protein (DUF488 family) n=1 Tax=Nocardioides massiliensis TaxID=1325935 RepID=A0ABT9NNL7_9ACTN|nr:DUF488 domain-containing protein [Nocardioides massiliensis]MDP9821435.1 uncharacterized protein (DUF488 family) [Nocardioides massiliensis]
MAPSDRPRQTRAIRGRLVTFGHGTADGDELAALLTTADVGYVVDVRRFPGSRRNPTVARDALEQTLPAAGVDYRWEQRLGGRRRVAAEEQEVDRWWRVEAFRAYAAHTRSDEFGEAMAELLVQVRKRPAATAVMCSESLWWRCHRRLISDVAVLVHDVGVDHLGHDGRLTPHRPADGARVTERGLVYDRDPD